MAYRNRTQFERQAEAPDVALVTRDDVAGLAEETSEALARPQPVG